MTSALPLHRAIPARCCMFACAPAVSHPLRRPPPRDVWCLGVPGRPSCPHRNRTTHRAQSTPTGKTTECNPNVITGGQSGIPAATNPCNNLGASLAQATANVGACAAPPPARGLAVAPPLSRRGRALSRTPQTRRSAARSPAPPCSRPAPKLATTPSSAPSASTTTPPPASPPAPSSACRWYRSPAGAAAPTCRWARRRRRRCGACTRPRPAPPTRRAP